MGASKAMRKGHAFNFFGYHSKKVTILCSRCGGPKRQQVNKRSDFSGSTQKGNKVSLHWTVQFCVHAVDSLNCGFLCSRVNQHEEFSIFLGVSDSSFCGDCLPSFFCGDFPCF